MRAWGVLCDVDDLLCPDCRCGRLLFCPLCHLHFALLKKKALPPPERRVPRRLLTPPRKLEFFHRGQGAIVGIPVVRFALSPTLHQS